MGQVRNHLYKERRNKRITQDSMYNLIEVAYQTENFVTQIDIHPWLVCVVGMPEIMNELNDLLVCDTGETVKCYIDTTYKLGELFVTVLTFQHTLYESQPTIPVAFMLHEKRDQKYHERFLTVLKRKKKYQIWLNVIFQLFVTVNWESKSQFTIFYQTFVSYIVGIT